MLVDLWSVCFICSIAPFHPSLRYELAAEKYTLAYNQDPTTWENLANRVAAYLNLQEFTLAIRDCDTIIKHCADVALALADLQRVFRDPY